MSGSSSSNNRAVLSLVLLLLFIYFKKPFLLSSEILVSFNSNWTLVLWVISLQWWIASPYSSHVIWPCFQWPCAFFFCLSSRKWSLFSQDSLLPCLLDSWHFGITYSCAFKKWYLKTEQHGWTPRSWKAFSQGISPTYSRAACSLLTSMFWVNVFLEVFLYYRRF